ncbi:SGNH/GDSL hydrolase family protein [Algoriphagus hitonicola]|uniref:GDSL-like Lipase/Acylhydrolase family n=1 Tax=Algoriphagus hitonicola TaxID=435880 RepID=A0A1I2X4E6_9BACT|nr:SGNH/GDSL hydrolase family protein [Algoriphagus hitonicola]SFH07887.1 GDSL-like Lipase/Acylhydrolase family [Algoriphagus hitonicola]
MKETIKNFWNITVPVVFVLFVLVEIILSAFFWVEDPYKSIKNPVETSPYIRSQFKPNLKLEFEVDRFLSDMDEKVHFSTNNYGFRGDSISPIKSEDEFRIFLFGGSTMENMFIDDSRSIEKVLQLRLNDKYGKTVKVFNAAKSGDASPDHLAMLVHRVIHLEPDLIVFYAGFNDLTRVISGYDFLHLQKNEKSSSASWTLGLKLFLSNFQVYRRIHNVVQNIQNPNILEDIHLINNYKEKIEFVQKHRIEVKLDKGFSYESYQNNLKSFIGTCQSNGVEVVILTQASSWGAPEKFKEIREFHWMNFIDGKRIKDEELAIELDKINEINKKVALENDIGLLDIEKKIPKSLDYFYDDCHFNKKGVEVFSNYLYNFVLEKNLIP